MYLLVDIGGSSVKHGIWQNNQLIEQEEFPVPKSWEALVHTLVKLKSEKETRFQFEAVSFSLPGIINEVSGRVEGASSLAYLHGVDFRNSLENKLRLPVFMENDATCAALAEMTYGKGKNKENVLFIVIGTGIGGTIISNGIIQKGQHLFGGEVGMMLINGKDEWAKLGSAVHMAQRVSLEKGFDRYQLTGEEVFKLAESGDKLAYEAVEELYHYLALGLYNLQYIIDPEVILLGGGISRKKGLVGNIVRHLSLIMNYGQRSPLFPQIDICQFGNEANLIGAGISCKKQLAKTI